MSFFYPHLLLLKNLIPIWNIMPEIYHFFPNWIFLKNRWVFLSLPVIAEEFYSNLEYHVWDLQKPLLCISANLSSICFLCVSFKNSLYLPVEEWGGVVVHDVENFFYFLSMWVPSCFDSQYHPQNVSLVCQHDMVDTWAILLLEWA